MKRALERGNLLIAETSARESGLTLQERLELTALISKKQPERGRRVAAAWLHRWIEETPGVTIDDAALVSSFLAALGGPRHATALGALLEILENGQRIAT